MKKIASISSVPKKSTRVEYLPLVIRFRWHGQPPGEGCEEPLGICIFFDFLLASKLKLTKEELKEDIGIAFGKLVKKQLHLVFTRPAALANGTINLSKNFFVSKKLAHSFGKDQVEILRGIYKVDFSTFTNFGEVFLDVSFKKGK